MTRRTETHTQTRTHIHNMRRTCLEARGVGVHERAMEGLGKMEREREGGREGETERERERMCMCCVHTMRKLNLPGDKARAGRNPASRAHLR